MASTSPCNSLDLLPSSTLRRFVIVVVEAKEKSFPPTGDSLRSNGSDMPHRALNLISQKLVVEGSSLEHYQIDTRFGSLELESKGRGDVYSVWRSHRSKQSLKS